MSRRIKDGDTSRPPQPVRTLQGYEVRWRDMEGKPRKKFFRGQSKRQADSFFADTKSKIDRGVYVDLLVISTVAEYTRQWIEIQPYRAPLKERRLSQLRTHIEPASPTSTSEVSGSADERMF